MKKSTTGPIVFKPNEAAALFYPEHLEMSLSPAGLHYLGVVRQNAATEYAFQKVTRKAS